MAIVGSFGLPELHQQAVAEDQTLPRITVLVVVRNGGGFAVERQIAASTSQELLKQRLADWLQVPANRQGYVSYKLIQVPFLLPPS